MAGADATVGLLKAAGPCPVGKKDPGAPSIHGERSTRPVLSKAANSSMGQNASESRTGSVDSVTACAWAKDTVQTVAIANTNPIR